MNELDFAAIVHTLGKIGNGLSFEQAETIIKTILKKP